MAGPCGSYALPDGDRRAERRDLREREVHEDDAALDDVQAEVGVDARDDQARGDRRGEERRAGPDPLAAPSHVFNAAASMPTL